MGYSRCFLLVLFTWFISCSSFYSVAAATQSPEKDSLSFIPVLASLLLVLAAILALAFVVRKMNLGFSSSRAIKVVSAISLGTKERVVVVEVGGKQHVLGVTANQVNHLFELDEPIDTASQTTNQSNEQTPLTFQKILQGFSEKREQQK